MAEAQARGRTPEDQGVGAFVSRYAGARTQEALQRDFECLSIGVFYRDEARKNSGGVGLACQHRPTVPARLQDLPPNLLVSYGQSESVSDRGPFVYLLIEAHPGTVVDLFDLRGAHKCIVTRIAETARDDIA